MAIRWCIAVLLLWAGIAYAAASNPVSTVLAQANPSATTLTDIYTCPSTNAVQITTVWITNRDTSAHAFRLSVAAAGAADDPKQYIYYGLSIPANGAFVQSVNLPLLPGDKVRAWADAQQLTFSLYGNTLQ